MNIDTIHGGSEFIVIFLKRTEGHPPEMTDYYRLDAITHLHALEVCDGMRSLPTRDHYAIYPRGLGKRVHWDEVDTLVIDLDSGVTKRFGIEFKEPE